MQKLSEEVKPISLEEDLKTIIGDMETISKKIDLPLWQLLPIMTHREIVIMNQQLRAIHEHLDMIEERQRKKESSE